MQKNKIKNINKRAECNIRKRPYICANIVNIQLNVQILSQKIKPVKV